MLTSELKSLMHTLAPQKVIAAYLEEASYAVSVQEIHWTEPGAIHVLSGRHCLIELAEAPASGRANYWVQMADGRECPVGRLNFMPPESARQVRWNAGRRHAIVCVMDPQRLGVLGATDWRWDDTDISRTLNMNNERLRMGMQWLAEETASPSFAGALQINCILTMLAIELQRYCANDKAAEDAPKGKLSAHQLKLLDELIGGANDPGALSLDIMAQACKLPARELSTLFKRTTGQTLRSHVAAAHIGRAKVLLDDGDLLVKQVAHGCGFRSAAAFGDAFRRATGLTPLQYRLSQGVASQGAPVTKH